MLSVKIGPLRPGNIVNVMVADGGGLMDSELI